MNYAQIVNTEDPDTERYRVAQLILKHKGNLRSKYVKLSRSEAGYFRHGETREIKDERGISIWSKLKNLSRSIIMI